MARRRTGPSSPGNGDQIPPRGPNESAYDYRVRRTMALYGQTPYERRIFLAQQRGIGLTAARGHATGTSETESQRRNRLSVQQYGETVSQRRTRIAREWLEANGYTPELTGMSWTSLQRLEPRLRYMFEGRGEGTWVTPEMIRDARDLEESGELESGWAFERLWQKYEDTRDYREYQKKLGGRASWAEYRVVNPYIPSLAPQWWYYH